MRTMTFLISLDIHAGLSETSLFAHNSAFSCNAAYFGKLLNSLTTKMQTTKFSSVNFQKNLKSKLYHIEI